MLARLIRSEPVYLFCRSPAAMLAAVVALGVIGGAIFAPLLARTDPYDLSTFSLMDGLLPPVWEGGDPRVDEKVRSACQGLSPLGVTVEDISVPMHLQGAGVTFAGIQSMMTSMFHLDGCLLERPDVTPEGYLLAQAKWRSRADELPHNVKVGLLGAKILQNRYGFTYVARAMQRLPAVRAAYDRALEQFDILVMPTTVTTAPALPAQNADAAEVVAAAFGPLGNTAPFNSTHHPALSIPCGMLDGLPVGMMLIGRHWDEGTLYRLAQAFEQQRDWRQS